MFKYLRRSFIDLKKYRHFISYSVKSNLKAELSNTVLGYLWWLLDPFLHMVIYTFLVTIIFQKSTPAFPVYVFCALLPWKVATASINQSTKCIRQNAGIIKQVYLPIFILPLNIILTNTIKLFFGMSLLLIMLLIYRIPYTWHIVEFIPIYIVFFCFFFLISLFFSHFGVLFDDMGHLVGYLLMFWFFSSPGMWSLELIPESLSKVIWINPNVTFFMSVRNVLMYGKSPFYRELGIWFGISMILILILIPVLYRAEKNYSKVI